MALVFGGKKDDDWTPTKQDYAVFLAMIFVIISAAIILKNV